MNRLVVLVASLTAAACGSPDLIACPAIAVAGLDVSVIAEQTGQGICDATVTAIDGSHQETLTPFACRYTGAFERPGTYRIRVQRNGFQSAEVANVRVVMGTGDCPHVETVQILVRLSAEPQ